MSSTFKKSIYIFLVIFIVSGLVYISYLYGKLSQKRPLSETQKSKAKDSIQANTSPTPQIWPTYIDTTYNFKFSYPPDWELKKAPSYGVPGVILTKGQHEIYIQTWKATEWGICFNYGPRKKIQVGGKKAETADGVFAPDVCSEDKYIRKLKNKGETYVYIPLEKSNQAYPAPKAILILYDYPLKEKPKAKQTLNRILSTFRFSNVKM